MEVPEAAHIPLDRVRIVQTAIHILNETGLKELSMRKIADALQVKASSLYYHVKDKDQLLQLLADQICGEMVWPESSLSWKDQILQWAGQFRKILHSCRDAVEIFSSTLPLGYNRLMQVEKLYQLFVSAGFADHQIPWMASMLKNYVLGFAAEEVRLAGLAGEGDAAALKLSEQYNQFYRQLPEERFPNMIRLASYTTDSHWEQEFHFGLNVLIDGFSLKLGRE